MIWINSVLAKALLLLSIACLSGCKVVNYSFSGVTIDCANEPTLTVGMFEDNSEGGPATISQGFTERVREYYQNNTCLSLSPFDGDYRIEGAITGYNLTPQAPTGNETASLMRLTITVTVNFESPNEDEGFTKRTFSFFSDYNRDQDLTTIEESLIEEISEQIILDMFNATVATW